MCTVDISALCGSFELAGVSSLRFLVFCSGQGSWCGRKSTWSSWHLRSPPCVYSNSHLSVLSLQIDLRYEAQNLEHFQHNFQDMTSVKFPTPLHPLITRDILVETYEVRTCICLLVVTVHSHRGFRWRDVILAGKSGRRLGMVEGLSCMCKALDPLSALQKTNLLYTQSLGGAEEGVE